MTPEQKQQHLECAEELLKEQNFGAAVIAGAITTLLGSGIYAVVALLAGGQSISVILIAIGAAIGFVIQFLGRGITTQFTLVAAVFGLASYPLSRLCTIALYTQKVERISLVELFSSERLAAMWSWVFSGLRLTDLLFWILAVAAAAYFAKRRLSRDEDAAIYTFVHR